MKKRDTSDSEPGAELVEWTPPETPSWDRARGYCAPIRQSADAIVRLGMELTALHVQWFNQGGDSRFVKGVNELSGRKADDLRKGGFTKVAPRPSVTVSLTPLTNRSERPSHGWQAKVKEELGISHVTALNIMSRALAIIGIRRLALGVAVEWDDSRTKKPKILEPTPEVSEKAREFLSAIESGGVSPTRAWAGIVGEGMRRQKNGGIGAKAPTDHARNLTVALVKLQTSLRFWKRLDPEERADIETLWQRVRKLLPDTWEA